MGIRAKIILVVLPVLVSAVLVVGLSSAFSAQTGITALAAEALGFKAQELRKYADSQWNLLVANDLAEDAAYLAVTRRAVQSYASTLLQSDSELVFGVDRQGGVAVSTAPITLSSVEERAALRDLAGGPSEGWQRITIDGVARVAQAFRFDPFDWLLFITDTEESFYAAVREINLRTYYVLGASVAVAILLVMLFAGVLTGPLTRSMYTMLQVIRTNDLSARVTVEYRDEIGAMATTFNRMLARLEDADRAIRDFALRAVIARRNERKIRSLFQQYVPNEVIESVVENPESALVGDSRIVAILFTDIRNFTTISENSRADDLVLRLNRYFEPLVDIIMDNHGVVNKYIGDAIMAFFGTPEKRDNAALDAVRSALQMQRVLSDLNAADEARGVPPFRTGVGIDYGGVVVGNIGTEKKMEYTIIGPKVNWASRLESLTKAYRQPVIFSESVFRRVKAEVSCRFVDKVQVKGALHGENVYTAALELTDAGRKVWGWHHAGVELYLKRQFAEATRYFRAIAERVPSDRLAAIYLERCAGFQHKPPPVDWDGSYAMTEK